MKIISILLVSACLIAFGSPTTPPDCYYETYGHGGFSQENCNQGNVRCTLDQNFACLTNTALIVGVDNDACHFLLFNTTDAISAFSRGEGGNQINGALNSTEVNPTSSDAGQLAIQLLAAELNIRLFRCIGGDCTGADITDLCFLDGPCLGATVKDVVAAAHVKVAGCDDSVPCTAPGGLCDLSLETMRVCLNDFNDAFKGGNSTGYVNVCPPPTSSTVPSTGSTGPSTGSTGPSTGSTGPSTDSTGPSSTNNDAEGGRRSSASVMAASALLVCVVALL